MSELAKTLRLSAVPLYIQVAAELRRRIESGRWASGQKISTIEDLQAEFGVARVTVRQAVGPRLTPIISRIRAMGSTVAFMSERYPLAPAG